VRLSLRIFISLMVAAALLALLFHWGNLSTRDLVDTWKRLPALVYLEALGVHASIYVLRSIRFRLLLPSGSRPAFGALLGVSAAHNLASYVLPAKTGEASLVLYLKKVCAVPGSEGLASLVVSRLLDLATMFWMLGGASLALAGGGILEQRWVPILGVLLLLGSLVLFVLAARGDWLVLAFVAPLRLLRLESTRFGSKLAGRARDLGLTLREAGGGGRLWKAALVSIPLWLGVFAFFLILARGFGMAEDLSPLEGLFGSSWAMLANLLPINGFAGAGTQELGWVVGFRQLGIPDAAALSAGLGVHLVQLVNVVGMGLLGHLSMALLASPQSEG
jgi:hypothetical protein